jgi:uncharacterized protein (TIGR02147 family)
MNIFVENNYRQVLKRFVEERKAVDTKFHFQAIADATKIPKSYISKVMTQKAHFNQDQLYLFCDHVGMNDHQRKFMSLLLEWERCVVKKRKSALNEEINLARAAALDTQKHIQASTDAIDEQIIRDYFLEPWHQIVHICLSIPKYQTNANALAADLNISASRLRTIIANLEGWGVIEHTKGSFRTLIKNFHLPKTSPVFSAWRNQLKLFSMERLGRSDSEEDYSFMATFSATPKVRDKIKGEFLEFLKKTEALVRSSPQEAAFQVNFDLFGWLK